MKKHTAIALLAVAFGSPAAPLHAKKLPIVIYPGKWQPLKINGLYSVDMHCRALHDLPPEAKPGLGPVVAYQGSTAVVVTNGTLYTALDVTKLPSNTVSMVVPFSFNTDPAKGDWKDFRKDCSSYALVKGPVNLFVTGLFNTATTPEPGTLDKALTDVAKVATSLAPVVTGAPLAVNTAKNLAGVSGALGSLDDLFVQLFPATAGTHQAGLALPVGRTSVETYYSRVDIDVTPVTSVVAERDKDSIYFNDLDAAIKGVTFDAGACSSVASTLAQAGFTSPVDQAYGVGRLAVLKLKSRQAIAQCLAARLCPVAIQDNMTEILWDGIDPGLKPTAGDCQNLIQCPDCSHTVQPTWDVGAASVLWLANSLRQYVNSSNPSLALPNKYVAGTLNVQDSTSQKLFSNLPSSAAKSFYDAIKSSGFKHFGCWTAVTDTAVSGLYGAMASFVSAKDGTGGNVQFKDALVIYPIFENGVISTLALSDNATEIQDSMGKLDGCDGVKIVPDGTPAPGAPAPKS